MVTLTSKSGESAFFLTLVSDERNPSSSTDSEWLVLLNVVTGEPPPKFVKLELEKLLLLLDVNDFLIEAASTAASVATISNAIFYILKVIYFSFKT